MPGVPFEELGFSIRPDLTPYLVHLTRSTSTRSAMASLGSILREGRIRGATSYVKGKTPAACFMDVPFAALKYVCARRNWSRYEPYGVIVRKDTAYRRGARPVLYLSDEELDSLRIDEDELWRVVRFEGSQKSGWIGWLHEREWRCPEEFVLPKRIIGVLVRTSKEAAKLAMLIHTDGDKFACLPKSVIPLQVITQGLPRG